MAIPGVHIKTEQVVVTRGLGGQASTPAIPLTDAAESTLPPSPGNKYTKAGILKLVDQNKDEINKYFNITSAIANFAIFAGANLNLFEASEEGLLVKTGNFLARIATAARGVTGAVDCYIKNNLIPLIGSVLEPVVSLFVKSGYYLWLARGFPQSIRQVQAYTKRLGSEFKTSDGKTIKLSSKDGDNFANYGISTIDGFTNTLREMGKSVKELARTPFKKEGFFSRAMIACASFQFLGPVVALLGLHKLGALFRDTGGVLVDAIYMTDKDKDTPSYVIPGSCWMGAAIADYAKLWQPIDDTVKNLTQFSNGLDQIAGILESRANFGNKSANKVA